MRGIEPVLVAPLRSGKGELGLGQRGRTGKAPREAWLGAGRGRRLAMGLLWVGLAAAASVRLGSIAFQPVLAGYRSGREIQDLAADYRDARLRNQRLHRQIAYLKTSAGVEEEARRLGWVRAGERPLQIVLPDRPAAAKSGWSSAQTGERTQPATAPLPRSSTAERVQQMLATWSATRWLGAVLQRKS